MSRNFVHLHLHTQYSVLDGAIKIPLLIDRVKELGQPAVAMTDHGVIHGAIEFYQAARAQEVKPILGCEVYVSGTTRFDRTPRSQGGSKMYHLTLLAQNNVGYRNLCRMVSRAYLEGFYFKPRVDRELLREHSEGLICLSGCVSGELSCLAQLGAIEKARSLVEEHLDIFGDRYYIEIQPHALSEQRTLNKMALELAEEFTVPLVATNDCHYLSPGDKQAQEVLMCVSMGKLLSDPDRIRHDDSDLHIKSTEEMYEAFPNVVEALENTVKIADCCNLDFDFSTYRMPKFDTPENESLDDFFASCARAGLVERKQEFEAHGHVLTSEQHKIYSERLEEEISLIVHMGFPGYFLVVSDFIRWAKNHDIPVGPGRGSAAGSLVAYVLFITDIDPIEHNLLFERFLNPERVSMPDIDVDFCINGRDKVIEYVCNKYGKDKVAQICTFGTLKAKAVIKDVGRVLGFSYAETDRIAKLIPQPRQGFDYPIAEALKMEKKLREYAEGEGRELMTLSQKLEGLSRHISTHAAGLVIADEPVMDLLPLLVDKDGQVVTQLSMNWVEKVGLVKFDFLGLKTLTVLHDAVAMIKQCEGVDIELVALPIDDAKTYRVITAGRTIGVFQLESSGITEMVGRLKPNCFEDLVAILALYRPGPLDAGMVDHYINRKHGRERVTYPHLLLEPILRDTYGIILYQEQIMRIARDMGGYSLGQADMLRRVMGKKKPEEMAKHRELFVNGAVDRSVPRAVATEVFDQMETFARYGFNRSHSVAYALISYQTAYLKAHYPAYLMAALMTHEMHDTDKTLKNLNECRGMGIEVLTPDINKEDVVFHVRDGKILFGLAAIKGVGHKAVARIIKDRDVNGEFRSLLDFCKRIDSSVLNRRLLENFIKSGAFDWTEVSRAELIARIEDVVKIAQRCKADAASKQMDMFAGKDAEDANDYVPNRQLEVEWPLSIRLACEKEALGYYLSGHPLECYAQELKRLGTISIVDVMSLQEESCVVVAGIISLLRLKNTRKGDRYATFLLEDLLGTIEVIVWPDVYSEVQDILSTEEPVVIRAKLDVSDERRQLIAQSVESAITLRKKTAREAIVKVPSKLCSETRFNKLKTVLENHKGTCSVKLIVCQPSHSETVITLSEDIKIDASEALCNNIERLFGEPVVTFR